MEGVAAGYGRQQRRVQGVQRDAMAAWAERLAGVRGVLLDISGVLYDSGAGGGAAIAGSVEAVARLVGSTRGGGGGLSDYCGCRGRGVHAGPASSRTGPALHAG